LFKEFYKSISEENLILDDFKERMKSAYEIINQLNCLIQVEKSVLLAPKYDNTLKDKQSNLFWYLYLLFQMELAFQTTAK